MKFRFEENKPKKGRLVLMPENDLDVYDIGRFVGKANMSYQTRWTNKKINHLAFEIDSLWRWIMAANIAKEQDA